LLHSYLPFAVAADSMVAFDAPWLESGAMRSVLANTAIPVACTGAAKVEERRKRKELHGEDRLEVAEGEDVSWGM
jgi:hypothetical protein